MFKYKDILQLLPFDNDLQILLITFKSSCLFFYEHTYVHEYLKCGDAQK